LKFNQALEEINQQITNKQRRLEKIASVYEDIKVNEIDVAKFSQSINELNNINTKLQNQVNNLMQQSEDTGQAKGRLIELQDQMKVLEDGKLKKIEDLDYLQAAREMLTDSGIKTKVIKQYLPIMNQLINRYLASMDFFINFKLDNEFREIIRSRFRDEFSYSSFSEGEKVRINLALLFTWRAIAKMKNSISTNLLLLDEIFDSSLDGQGTDDFIKILNTLEGENVFIISHKQDLIIDKFKNVMKFEKYKNFTRIAE
jgi:DNA repair exonuclease SbcCD ATPase subunit